MFRQQPRPASTGRGIFKFKEEQKLTISNEQITAVGTVIGSLVTMGVMMRRAFKKYDILEFKVETLWAAQLRRAQAEAVTMGHGQANSPFTANPESAALFPAEMLREMADYLATFKKALRDSDLVLLLEHRFGAQVSAEVCSKHGLTQLGCLLVALSLIRGGAIEIENGDIIISEAVLKGMIASPAPKTPVVVVPLDGEVAAKLSELVEENKRQTSVQENMASVLDSTAKEVHAIREDSAIGPRPGP